MTSLTKIIHFRDVITRLMHKMASLKLTWVSLYFTCV